MKFISIPAESIDSDPSQPRKQFDENELRELGSSLAKYQLVPILVVVKGNRFELIDGERRWRAAQLLGIKELKAIVFAEKPSEANLLEIQVTVNCQRADLQPLEKLDAYTKLMTLRGWNASELAKSLSISKANVSKILMLDDLSPEDKRRMQTGELGLAAGYEIARHKALLSPKIDCALNNTNGLPPMVSRVVCRLSDFTVTVAGTTSLQVADLIAACERLARECRKAVKSGLDVSTFARVLKDQAKQEGRLTQ